MIHNNFKNLLIDIKKKILIFVGSQYVLWALEMSLRYTSQVEQAQTSLI